MRSDEARALGDLAGEAAAGIATQVRDVHAGIAGRVFGMLRRAEVPAEPVRVAHDAIAAGAYAASRGLAAGALRGGGALLALSRPLEAPSLHEDARGRIALGALAGVYGDRLAETGSPLTGPLRLLVDPTVPRRGRIVVFVHGLGETEDSWRLAGRRAHAGRGGADYGERLAAWGLTPVYARYNSGRGIGDSARELAGALTALLEDGALGDVEEIALVGHSMGGLVVREAPLHADPGGWPARVSLVVTLGSPHEGAALARGARSAAAALERLPETRPFAAPLSRASAGIRDLADGRTPPFLAHAEHLLVSASVTRDPEALGGRILGDLLVHRRSAWAQRTATEPLPLPGDAYRHLGGATHFALLGHPAVAELLEQRLARRALPRPRPELPAAASASAPAAAQRP